MNNFLDKLKGDKNANKGDKNSKRNAPFQNPFAAVGKAVGGNRKFGGEGQSLGGSRPGRVIPIKLEKPGPLGLKVEKRPNSQGTAIIATVIDGGQAQAAGLQRGDILCHAGSNGEHEIMYDQFLAMADSNQRPLVFEVRRIPSKSANAASKNNSQTSAEAFSRKQAVIAAAEAREKAHKTKTAPISKAKDTNKLQPKRQPPPPSQQGSAEPMSEAARRAIEAAKKDETLHAAQLGYNPYETAKANAGQARTATVAMTHGAIGHADSNVRSEEPLAPPPAVDAPVDANVEVSDEFQDAFAALVTTNEEATVKVTLGVIRKLILNATTKGQATDDEAAAAKFRKVRLSNSKIKSAITDVHGALDVMLSVGFQLAEEDGESFLVYPPGDKGPEWLPTALKQMEERESSS